MKTDTGGPAYPKIEKGRVNSSGHGPHVKTLSFEGVDGMTLLDAAALAAFPEKLRCFHNEDAVKHAYNAGEAFIAEKRRREGE